MEREKSPVRVSPGTSSLADLPDFTKIGGLPKDRRPPRPPDMVRIPNINGSGCERALCPLLGPLSRVTPPLRPSIVGIFWLSPFGELGDPSMQED